MRPLLICAVLFLFAADPASAQHEYPATDVENGGRLFLSTCAACHGPDGDGVGGVDLGRGQFRRATTDEDLVGIIQKGIPDTGMPPNNVSLVNAQNIVAYLRSMSEAKRSISVPGDPVRGRAIFEGKGSCGGCHRVGMAGSRLGPDLTTIGSMRRAVELERAILDPAAVVLPSQRAYRAVGRDGTTTTGRLLNHDLFTVQLLDSKERLVSLQKASLREHGFVEGTTMPSSRGRLSDEEVADLVSYLVSLKGPAKP